MSIPLLNKNILFFGSDHISLNTLKHLSKHCPHLAIVLPPYAKPRTPLAELHEFVKRPERSIPIFYEFHAKEQWPELAQKLDKERQDVGVVASFGHMIPDYVIDKFNYGMMVMHPSLLPKYRGSCPLQHVILNNEKETGVTVIEISKNKFDAGAILFQQTLPMDENTRYSDLAVELPTIGAQGIVKVLSDYEKYKRQAQVQDASKVTKAPMIKEEMGNINFSQLSALEVQLRFNALYGSNTKPRAIIKTGFSDKLLHTRAYFNRLDRVNFSIDRIAESILIDELPQDCRVPAGILHWNKKKDDKRMFVKCHGGKDQWGQFEEITLSGFGKTKVKELISKHLGNHPYSTKHNPKFSYSFE